MLVDLEPELVLAERFRQLDDRDAERNLAGVFVDDLANAADALVAHVGVADLERDLLDLLVADAVERHDLQRVKLRRDRRLVKGGGVRGEGSVVLGYASGVVAGALARRFFR